MKIKFEMIFIKTQQFNYSLIVWTGLAIRDNLECYKYMNAPPESQNYKNALKLQILRNILSPHKLPALFYDFLFNFIFM